MILPAVVLLLSAAACVSRDPGVGDSAPGAVPAPMPAATSCDVAQRPPYEPAKVGAAVFEVNRLTRGMAARTRWALSPDSSAMLVVEDPFGVEAEPVPDGVLFASERTGRTWRMDSVWSAAPSPDWTRVAVGRAVIIRGGEAQRIDPAGWSAAAHALAGIAGPSPSLSADSLRAYAVPASGMSVAEGSAATFVADVDRDVAQAPLRVVAPGGWRIRWSCDGADLLIGRAPKAARDDAPGESEVRVSASARPIGSQVAAVAPRWMTGPSLEIGTPTPSAGAARLLLRGRIVEGKGGRVLVADGATVTATTAWRDVGPGIPLAATRGGRFILSVAPRTTAAPYESPDHLVVYRVP